MTEKDLFELGFIKDVDFDEQYQKEFVSYRLKNLFGNFLSYPDEIEVFQDDEVNNGDWTLCISGGSYKDVNLNSLKWLVDMFNKVDEQLPNIKY